MANPPDPSSTFPSALDQFREVTNGETSESIVHADYINKVQNALRNIQAHIQYTPKAPTAPSGVLLYTTSVTHKVLGSSTGAGKRQIEVPVNLDSTVVRSYFGNDPFAARYGALASGLLYKLVQSGGTTTRRYSSLYTAVRVDAGATLQAWISCFHDTGDYEIGDILEVTLTLIRS